MVPESRRPFEQPDAQVELRHLAEARTVLVVDDEPGIRQLLGVILQVEGHRVLEAACGADALALVAQQRVDLITLDVMMPDMDGWEVYQQIKANEETKLIPVIVVTAKSQSIDKVLGLHIAKVDDYITKPFGPQELLESVEKILARQL